LIRKRSILPEARTEQRRSAEGAFAGTLVAGHVLGGRKEDWGFLEELEEEEGKESSGRWRNYSVDGIIYSPRWGR
jgi:hypothetical protein